MIAVAVVASFLGIVSWKVRGPVVFLEAAPPPTSANTDHDIFDIVLTDLINDPEFNFTIGGPLAKRTQIVMHAVTKGHLRREYFNFDKWPKENGTPEDVLDDIVARNPKGKQFALAGYQPSTPNITVTVLRQSELDDPFQPRYPSACGYVIPYLPGYSRDGTTALFLFRLPPLGYHPGWGCYLLKKTNGRWDIAKKRLYHLM
jgi:hypothetical protein